MVESKTPIEKILHHNLREFLLGNFQIGFMSQRLVSKTSCMELRTPHETQPYLFYQIKIQIWRRERERERDFGRVNMREFLFGNSQIGSTSQGLISKTSCIELGTPHETRPYLL